MRNRQVKLKCIVASSAGYEPQQRDSLFKLLKKAAEMSRVFQDCLQLTPQDSGGLGAEKGDQDDPKKLSVPVTVRTLETLTRLATAHAKLRLATHVEVDDIELAGNLLNMTIFNEKPEEEVADADNEEMKEEEQADQDEGAAQ